MSPPKRSRGPRRSCHPQCDSRSAIGLRSGRAVAGAHTLLTERPVAAGQGAEGHVVAYLNGLLDLDAPVRSLDGLPTVERAEGREVRCQALLLGSGAAVVRRHHAVHRLIDGAEVVRVDHTLYEVAHEGSERAIGHGPIVTCSRKSVVWLSLRNTARAAAVPSPGSRLVRCTRLRINPGGIGSLGRSGPGGRHPRGGIADLADLADLARPGGQWGRHRRVASATLPLLGRHGHVRVRASSMEG